MERVIRMTVIFYEFLPKIYCYKRDDLKTQKMCLWQLTCESQSGVAISPNPQGRNDHKFSEDSEVLEMIFLRDI